MKGKVVVGGILATALLMGAGLWYANQYAYYHEVSLGPALAMTLVPKEGGAPSQLSIKDFRGIDADTSPIRFRACFSVATPLPELGAHYAAYPGATPLLAPRWFSCFKAKAISLALASGEAKAFLAQKAVAPEVDRVIAVFPDGRAYAWQQLDPAAPPDTSLGE